MDYTRIIKVFLASPMDLIEERKVFVKILEQINDTLGQNLHMRYQVVSWEKDVIPDKGDDAQDVVNSQIKMDYDVFVCVFRDRIGTPTQRAVSGTIEEYQRALAYKCTNPHLHFMLYFFKLEKDNQEIQKMKDRVQQDGLLYMEPDSLESFERMIYRHFSKLLMDTYKRTAAEDEPQNRKQREVAVAAALITPDNRLLMVQRSASSKYAPSFWQLPGGKAEPAEKPMDALIREVQEELSLTLNQEAVKRLQVFHSYFMNDKTRVLDIHLFVCRLDDVPEIQLNEENQRYEWVDMVSPALHGKQLLGLHQDMVQVVWQEVGIFSLVEKVLTHCTQLDTMLLPAALPDTNQELLHGLYAMLSALGFVKLGDVPQLASPFSKKLLDALLRISRSGTQLLQDDQNDPIASLKLLPGDLALLRKHREKTLYSHQSLLAMMSCKASLPNSTRHVSNVLIFGENQHELYLLLRWDFFSNKYQLLASGIKDAEEMASEDMAKQTISKRFDNMACRYFNYLPIKEYTTSHFAAGSVDDDPILRRYIIHPVTATVRRDCREDFLEAIRRVNGLTNITLEYSFSVSVNQRKRMNYFCWCRLDELMKERCTYRNLPLRGFEEMMSNIGYSDLMMFAQNPIPLQDDDVKDTVPLLLRQYNL